MKKNKNWKSVFIRRFLLVLLAILLGFSVYLTNASRLARNQLPMPFGTGFAVVLSGSMEPTLHVGDMIVVRKSLAYHENDIVVYQGEKDLIVHRIVSIENDTYTTQGDANNVSDDPITKERIKGVMLCRIPVVGQLIRFLRTPAGILLILILAVGFIEGSFRADKKSDDERLNAIKEEIRRLKEQQNHTEDNERN